MMSEETMIYDYVVFAIFVLGSTSIAFYAKYVGPKEKTKSDYVFGTQSVSMFAMMLSLARGTLGIRSLLGYPSELIYRGSGMWETVFGIVLSFPIVTFVFIPVYYSLGITSIYEYLDLRFKSRLVRCLASATYILRMILNLGVTVFTPCIALKIVIGLPYWASIFGLTAVTVFFTVMGGLKTAILADVIQGSIMIAITLVIIVQGTFKAGGIENVFNVSNERGRLKFFEFEWDPTLRVTTFSAIFGQLFISLSQYGCQQNLVQRYCSMKSEKHIRKTLLWNMPLIAIFFSLFWIMGMAIFTVYSKCDPLQAGYIKNLDEVVPFYVDDQFNFLPGFLGLCMATLFNGALSIYASQLSSIATVTWEDFISYLPIFRDYKDKQQLLMIKLIGAIYGVLIMAIAFGVSLMSGVVDSSMLITSATSGPLLGVFLLALLVPSANWKGAASGMILSHGLTLWLAFGSYTIDKAPIKRLPLSTENCTNTTFNVHAIVPETFWTSIAIPINDSFVPVIENPEFINRNFFTSFYSISYMYYCLFGTLITVLIGSIVSLWTPNAAEGYKDELLHPIARKLKNRFSKSPIYENRNSYEENPNGNSNLSYISETYRSINEL